MLTDTDREEFQRAIQLIQAVISRHSTDITAPLLVALEMTLHDINVVQKYLASVNTEK